MKKFILLVLFACCALFGVAQKSIPKPNPPRLVVDNAGVLSSGEQAKLEQELEDLDNNTSNQIAIVLVKTLNDQPIEDVAVNTLRDWGIGNKKTNNGILILAAIDDRHVRIEIGYGLEGAIPDITTNDIIQKNIVPNFKDNNYYEGLEEAIQSLGKAASGEYKVAREKKKSNSNSGGGILGFLIILFIVIFIISRGGGRGGGGMMSRRGYGGILGPMILGSMLGGGRSSSGWGGGGFGGGGGGGFGGFGGGSSGGGGASGSW